MTSVLLLSPASWEPSQCSWLLPCCALVARVHTKYMCKTGKDWTFLPLAFNTNRSTHSLDTFVLWLSPCHLVHRCTWRSVGLAACVQCGHLCTKKPGWDFTCWSCEWSLRLCQHSLCPSRDGLLGTTIPSLGQKPKPAVASGKLWLAGRLPDLPALPNNPSDPSRKQVPEMWSSFAKS